MYNDIRKYNVGDKVIIRSDLKGGEAYGLMDTVDEMLKFRGKEATIMDYHDVHTNVYFIDLDNQFWTWTDEMFESK